MASHGRNNGSFRTLEKHEHKLKKSCTKLSSLGHVLFIFNLHIKLHCQFNSINEPVEGNVCSELCKAEFF